MSATILRFGPRVSVVDGERRILVAASAVLRAEFATFGRSQLLDMALAHHPVGEAPACGGDCVAVQAARRVLARQKTSNPSTAVEVAA